MATSALLLATAAAQHQRPQVMTLGVFHFQFPNLDARQVPDDARIDVLEPRYQMEIEDIVDRLARFEPTVIVIERAPQEQRTIDSLYTAYLSSRHDLSRGEEEQLGFRLAHRCGLNMLHCVDEWGRFPPNIDSLFNGTDSLGALKLDDYFNSDPDSALHTNLPLLFKTDGIRAALLQMNDGKNIEHSLGDYLIGLFKYEESEGDFTGVDLETGRWFNRNLRIFRNIQRIPVTPTDRILVIYGAGHMNLLNWFFRASPEYEFVSPMGHLR